MFQALSAGKTGQPPLLDPPVPSELCPTLAGLAQAAVRHGAVIFEQAPVTAQERSGEVHRLRTARGSVTAKEVLLATGAYTTANFGYFRRRIIPVGSFLIATRPLSADEVQATLPGNRTCVNSMNIGNYFRLAPDNRLIFETPTEKRWSAAFAASGIDAAMLVSEGGSA